LGQSLEELHKLAAKEGGTLNFYATLAQINAEKIIPVFEKRFPGIKVNHVDATSDKLVARAVTEARGGKTLGDVLQVPLENVSQAHDQKLLLEVTLPESGGISAGHEGKFLGSFGSSVYHCGLEHQPSEEGRRAQAV
jgi:ABC-type glycerol-3-phosphate transport system substrate-binding protein